MRDGTGLLINQATKRFIKEIELIKKNRKAKSFREIAKEIGWRESALSSARKEKINVPEVYILKLEEKYNVSINSNYIYDLEKRVTELEAAFKVLRFYTANLHSKDKCRAGIQKKMIEINKNIKTILKKPML